MNKIIYAHRESLAGKITAKSYEILIPDGGGAIVIPPLKTFAEDFSGIRIIFDNAVLPFKEVVKIADNDEGAIAFTAAQAVKYFEGEAAKKDLILTGLGNLLTGYAASFAAESGFSPVVEIVLAVILRGVSDCTFNIRDCLKRLPLNYDYIRKLFKKETGATPYEYLLKERMTLAQQLLTSGITNRFSEYTVSQIAEACGYSEPLYFSRVFKQYFGVSPTEYK